LYNVNQLRKYNISILNKLLYKNILLKWGLGIGDWGLGPIPNPQSPNRIINNI